MKVVALGQRTWEKLPGIGIGVKFHHASIRTTADTQLNESSHQCWQVQTTFSGQVMRSDEYIFVSQSLNDQARKVFFAVLYRAFLELICGNP